ncbi:futalosine hydrolase [Mucilaginibacter sp. PAMB04274]|uniref:futalosine hydrolase n=1 Tax=Mucilaginibacter sp. PAMB04274 TaxID=3138568 RepID=UPI0031F62D81
MNILLVAATREEIGPLLESGVLGTNNGKRSTEQEDLCNTEKTKNQLQKSVDGESSFVRSSFNASQSNETAFHTLITGVGMVATAYALGQHLATKQYDLAINLGIAGSFDRDIALGEVVEITQDTFTESGAENDQDFITLDALGFGQITYTTHARLTQYSSRQAVRQVTAATVNTVHGNDTSIANLQQRISLQLESMEGAAFFYACQQAGVPALQIRAVSNYVEKRNRDAWKIGLAIKNLNTFAEALLRGL